jgi:hypothetical protein
MAGIGLPSSRKRIRNSSRLALPFGLQVSHSIFSISVASSSDAPMTVAIPKKRTFGSGAISVALGAFPGQDSVAWVPRGLCIMFKSVEA